MDNQSDIIQDRKRSAALKKIANKALICAWISFALCNIFPVFSLATTVFAAIVPLPLIGAFFSYAFAQIKIAMVAGVIALGIAAIINAIVFFVKYKKAKKDVAMRKSMEKSIAAVILSIFSLLLLVVNVVIVAVLTFAEFGFSVI